jgi:nitrate reductase gamma subunit
MLETVVALIVPVVAVALLTAMSLRANRRFRTDQRLPMQWSLRGSVNCTAPRKVALAITPVLAAVCLLAIAALTAFAAPRPGQEHFVIPVNVFTALAFLAVHAFHLWLIQRTLQQQS